MPYWPGWFKAFFFRYGFTSNLLTTEPILSSVIEDLFCKMQLTNHCLHPLLPPDKTLSHMLRARGHAFQLPTCTYNLHKKSFVISCLFKFLAWFCFSWCLILCTIAALPLSILYFDIYVCYMFNKITYLLTSCRGGVCRVAVFTTGRYSAVSVQHVCGRLRAQRTAQQLVWPRPQRARCEVTWQRAHRDVTVSACSSRHVRTSPVTSSLFFVTALTAEAVMPSSSDRCFRRRAPFCVTKLLTKIELATRQN